jgi:hypothetical protein
MAFHMQFAVDHREPGDRCGGNRLRQSEITDKIQCPGIMQPSAIDSARTKH